MEDAPMTSENVTEAVEPAESTPSKAVDDRLIDELVSRAQAEGLQLTGEGGLLQQLTKRLLESVQGELSYLVGPAAVILCATKVGPSAVAWGLETLIVVGGTGMALLNPPLGAEDEAEAEQPPRREWLGVGMVAVLTRAFGTTMLLSGVDTAIIATLEETGQAPWAAVVVAVLGAGSVIGGLVYGALSRPLPTWFLLGLLGLVTLPVGLAREWPWLCVAVLGTGLLAAPVLSALADAVTRLAPAGVRGEATGLQSSAQSAGFALGSPIAGVAVDVSVPASDFAAAGLAGLATALTGYLLCRRRPSPRAPASIRHDPTNTTDAGVL
ncbi:MFS transporter [Streptomyces cinereoruber]|uniref:MFS transporter n=4 Tax=Streptomyces cinereoruber TaxID=67260 RepID=A0ABX6B9U4_9ACTN|nr:MFS transporter [Streptomyces cinereoruber]